MGGKKGTATLPMEPPRDVSLAWLDGFLERHQDLKKALAKVVEPQRAAFATKENFDRYFDNLDKLYAACDYDPSMVANFDESYLIWGANRWKVITRATNKYGIVQEPQIGEHNTICVTIFADGTVLNPLVILPLSNMPDDIDPDKWKFFDWTGQKNGWMDKDIFDLYCRGAIIPAFQSRRKKLTGPHRRGLFIVDGHSSRMNPELWKAFADADIDLVTLPAHTSHITQPLDLCVFARFKRFLRPLPGYKDAYTAAEKRMALLKAAQHSLQMATTSYFIETSWKRSGVLTRNRELILSNPGVLHNAPPALNQEQATPSKKRKRINISNCIVTDIIDDVAAELEARALEPAAKKRTPIRNKKQVVDDSDDDGDEVHVQRQAMAVDEVINVNAGTILKCVLCGRQSAHGVANWSKCQVCEEVFVCDRCPSGLAGHYTIAHGDEPAPKRRSAARTGRFVLPEEEDDYLM